MPEDNDILTEQDAIQAIIQISEQGKLNSDTLIKLNTDLQNISAHVASLDDYLVIQKIEKEKQEQQKENTENEQKTEKIDKITRETEEPEAEENEITLVQIHEDLQTINENIEMNNYINVGNILFIGILVGAILFKTFWDRIKK